MSKRYVYVEGNDLEITGMFLRWGWGVAPSLFEADLLCLEGGADVSPEIYKEKNTDSTSSPVKDYLSFGLFYLAQSLNIPIVGICRGSQVINVALGGRMIQHVDGHCEVHNIEFRGEKYEVVCGHHQASIPNPFHYGDMDIIRADDQIVEIVVYKNDSIMGFQPHPEWADHGHESQVLFFKLVEEIMNG